MRMRRISWYNMVLVAVFFFTVYKLHNTYYSGNLTNLPRKPGSAARIQFTIQPSSRTTLNILNKERIVISFVVCESRLNESLNLVKSVLLFTHRKIHFAIFTEPTLIDDFNNTLTMWSVMTNNQFTFEMQMIKFPDQHKSEWMYLFSKCAAQRLFIPKLLPHIDSVIYVDVDTIILGPVEELWHFFSLFNSSQICAMALEDDNPNVSWYPRFAQHPFYGKYGVNSGVMLMNLTRMRSFSWTDYLLPFLKKYKLYIPWGDQDIINIIFHYHGSALLEIPCRYNYRSDQCMYGDACAGATSRGVFLLHGSRGTFHNDKQPAFQAMYRAIDEHVFGTNPSSTLVSSMEGYLLEAPESTCGSLKDNFIRSPKETLRNLYAKPER